MYSNVLNEIDKILADKNKKSKEAIIYIKKLEKEILKIKDENKLLRDDMQELSKVYFELTKQK